MALKKLTLAASAAVAGTMLVPAAASAQYYGDGYYERGYDRGYYQQVQRRYRPGDYYGDRGGYYERGYRERRYRDRGYRDDRYCRDDGDTGTIIGAIAGGLLGREVARGRDRYGRRGSGTTGAIIGGVAGALAGRAIDRDCDR